MFFLMSVSVSHRHDQQTAQQRGFPATLSLGAPRHRPDTDGYTTKGNVDVSCKVIDHNAALSFCACLNLFEPNRQNNIFVVVTAYSLLQW